MFDSHIHSDISFDSKYSIDDYVRAAKGLDGLIFTEHYDNFDGVVTNDVRARSIDMDEYREKMTAAKNRHGDFIRCGIELGLRPEKETEIKASKGQFDYDFVIGSSHIVCGYNVAHDKTFFKAKTKQEAYSAYLDEIYKNILLYREYFDVYGHLDYIIRYGTYNDNVMYYSEFSEQLDKILKLIIDSELGIEVNTSGFRKKLNMTHPNFETVKRYHELGGKIITVGSDSHTPEFLGEYFPEAIKLLREAGFEKICTFNKRKMEFTKI